MRRGRVTIAAGIAALAVSAAGQERWDLERVVAEALESNPEYLVSHEQVTEVELGIRQARAEAYPQVSLITEWEQSRNPSLLNSPDFDDFLDQFPDGFTPQVQELFSSAVDVQQLLYSWGKVGAGVDAAEEALNAARAGTQVSRLDVARGAAHAYFDLLAAQERVRTVARQGQARQAALEVVEARYEIAEATELERLRAQSALAQVAPEVARAQGQVRAAEANLRVVLGWTGDLPPLAAATTDLPPPVPDDEILVGRALTERPVFRQIDADLEFLRLRSVIVRADGKPQINLTGKAGRQVADTDDFSDDLFDDWRLGVGLDWSLYDGGRRESEAARFESQQQRRRLDRLAAALRVRGEVEAAAAVYRASLEAVEAARQSAETAVEATRVAEESYAEGVALQVDLLDAQQTQRDAELLRIESLYSAWKAWADLARAVGALPTDSSWTRGDVEPAAGDATSEMQANRGERE